MNVVRYKQVFRRQVVSGNYVKYGGEFPMLLPEKMTVAELEAFLTSKGVPTKGRKTKQLDRSVVIMTLTFHT